MKITETITTTTTVIEASAGELRESNTLAQNLSMMLSRVFQNKEPIYDDTDDDAEEQNEPDKQTN